MKNSLAESAVCKALLTHAFTKFARRNLSACALECNATRRYWVEIDFANTIWWRQWLSNRLVASPINQFSLPQTRVHFSKISRNRKICICQQRVNEISETWFRLRLGGWTFIRLRALRFIFAGRESDFSECFDFFDFCNRQPNRTRINWKEKDVLAKGGVLPRRKCEIVFGNQRPSRIFTFEVCSKVFLFHSDRKWKDDFRVPPDLSCSFPLEYSVLGCGCVRKLYHVRWWNCRLEITASYSYLGTRFFFFSLWKKTK